LQGLRKIWTDSQNPLGRLHALYALAFKTAVKLHQLDTNAAPQAAKSEATLGAGDHLTALYLSNEWQSANP
jgi:hypothetical protein